MPVKPSYFLPNASVNSIVAVITHALNDETEKPQTPEKQKRSKLIMVAVRTLGRKRFNKKLSIVARKPTCIPETAKIWAIPP